MITPSFSLTATERILPRLALDFTTASLDPRVTVTRAAASATRINASGVIESVAADTPRFDFDPVTLVCRGLLIESARTNLLLNSLIDGTSLSTQSVTVTAVAHTLSFYGTGSIVLSGTASVTVTGTGAYPTRTTLAFTPTAGSLTLTVSGTVQFAQLEVGGFATSFIPTASSQVTRNADVVAMTGTNFSDWYNQSEGSFMVDCSATMPVGTTGTATFGVNLFGDTNNRIQINLDTSSTNRLFLSGRIAGDTTTRTVILIDNAAPDGQLFSGKGCFEYKTATYPSASINGASVLSFSTGNTGVITGANTLFIGAFSSTANFSNGHVRKISYWPQAILNAELQAFSK